MASIFFSHGTADYPIAAYFKIQLEQMDSRVYLFEHDQQPGQNVADKLQKNIDASDIVFVLLTKQSQDAPYVHQEIGYAEKARKPVIPLVESGTGPRVLGMLAGREYIPFDPNNPDKSLSQAQTYVHNHDMAKLIGELNIVGGMLKTAEAVNTALLVGLVVTLLMLYYATNTQQGQE